MSELDESPQYFKKDEKGNLVWFPYSFWGKGYLMTDEASELIRDIKRYGSRFTGFLIVWTIGIYLLAFMRLIPNLTACAIAVLPIIIFSVFARIRFSNITESLQVSSLNISFIEWLHPELIRHYIPLFGISVVIFICSLVALAIGIGGTLTYSEKQDVLPFLLISILAVFYSFWMCRYLIRVRHSSKI